MSNLKTYNAVDGHSWRWDTATLTWVPWDGAVTGGGGGGGGLTDTELRASPVAVSGTFWQATQPVSAAALPLPSGAATSALQTQPGVDIGDVTVNNAAGAGAVNVQDGGNSLTVDGTFWQATQPVSGTFWQATQPVSIATMPSTPVTGTFWQATQPVSGTVTADAGSGTMAVSGPLTDAQLRASAVPITGSISATSAATATADNPSYVEGTPSDLSQTLGGQLRVVSYGVVSDTPNSYVVDAIHQLSLTAEGRLRVSSTESTLGRIWQNTFDDPWSTEDVSPYSADVDHAFVGYVPD